MANRINLHAPSLHSDITGELDQDAGLALFRGIPYASVEKRWTHSHTTHSLSTTFDATEFGPRCVQGDGPVLVSGGVNDPVPGDDEFRCLNLNICVPEEALPGHRGGHMSSKLPVMVWIHGGAFTYGANSVGRYRPQLLSTFAKNSGSPIILVQIGYRLGVFGFAASSDLASELQTNAKTNGYHNGDIPKALLGNYGLFDQRNAFDWVRSHIGDFGGDPSNVTAFGISAGSASIHYHILTGDPIFDRAILMSGAAPTLGPLPLRFYDATWKTLCANSKIHASTPSERLEQLRALSPEMAAASYPDSAIGPLADGTLLPSSWRLGEPQRPTRCKEIILGDTGVEAIIMDHLSHAIPQARFHELVHAAFSSPATASAFLTHFHFSAAPDLSYESYRDALRFFLSITMFQFPNLGIAETFAVSPSPSHPSTSFPSSPASTAAAPARATTAAPVAYLYHFEQPSPYPGPTFGIPYHGQCAIFMYQNECAAYPAPARAVAEEMARLWTAFAHGRRPWAAFEKAAGEGVGAGAGVGVGRVGTGVEGEGEGGYEGGKFMRFGPNGESTLQDFETDTTRDYAYLGWLRENFEEVKEFAQGITLGFVR